MTDEEKIKFVSEVFDAEIQSYISRSKKYDRQDEVWLDRYLTKSNTEGMIKTNLEAMYKTALNLNNK